MFKLLNKKKNNKGFTLVELVIVVAILAILVGILAPQYTKYVERSRKAADSSNLEELVKGVKVAAADGKYDVAPAKFTITIDKDGTKLAASDNGPLPTDITTALNEYAGTNWGETTLKSKSWDDDKIVATITIEDNGSVTVEYTPEDLKNNVKED